MADLEDLIQKISVDGADGVTEAFKQIGDAGKEAFTLLAQLAGTTAETLGAIVGAVTALSGVVSALAISAANSVVELSHLNAQSGVAVAQFKALGNTIGTVWPEIEHQVAASADNILEAHLRVQSAQTNLEASNLTLSESFERSQISISTAFLGVATAAENLRSGYEKSIQNMTNDTNSLRGAVLGVESAQNALDTLLGHPPSSSAAKDLQIRQAELALTNAQAAAQAAAAKALENSIQDDLKNQQNALALQKANLEASDAVAKARIQEQKDAENAKKAALDLSLAQRADSEAQLKDLPTIIKAVKDLADGTKQVAGGFNLAKVSVEDLAKGIIASSSKNDIAGNLIKPTSVQAIAQIANVFKNLEDASTKTALAIKLFGRGVNQELVDKLSEGSEAVAAYQKKMEALKLTITDPEFKVADELHSSFEQLKSDLEVIGQKVGLAFGDTVKQQIDALDETVRKFSADGTIAKWASAAATAFKEFSDGISTIIGWFTSLYDKIVEVVGQRAAFTALGAALGVIGAAVLLILSPFITWPIIIIAVITAIGALSEKWGDFKTFMEGVFTAIGGFFQTYLIGPIQAAIKWANDLTDAIRNWGNSTGNAPLPSSSPKVDIQGAATGGYIRGPGNGRDDKAGIFALSDREFVMNSDATAHWGVDFMHAINNMSLTGFARGGLVGRTAAQANNLSQSAKRVLNLTIGDQTFKGLTAPENVAKALVRYAVAAQTSSGGKQPGWVR